MKRAERSTVFCIECGEDHEVFDREPGERTAPTSVYKQIIPADGWVAVFSRNEPDESGRYFFTDPVAVWVLVEKDGSAFVGGLCGSHIHEEPWHFGNFLTYAAREEIVTEPDRFNEWAQRAAEARRKVEQGSEFQKSC